MVSIGLLVDDRNFSDDQPCYDFREPLQLLPRSKSYTTDIFLTTITEVRTIYDFDQ
ncbi:hypothetical protein CHS0354_009303, partial [Potamilus streckersoni]